MMSGVETAVVSLWKVSDEATNWLMDRFYTLWLEEGLPLAEAFHRARKEMRNYQTQEGNIFASPFFWGAFVLVGRGM
jgi:CHAT domain-containing protein